MVQLFRSTRTAERRPCQPVNPGAGRLLSWAPTGAYGSVTASGPRTLNDTIQSDPAVDARPWRFLNRLGGTKTASGRWVVCCRPPTPTDPIPPRGLWVHL